MPEGRRSKRKVRSFGSAQASIVSENAFSDTESGGRRLQRERSDCKGMKTLKAVSGSEKGSREQILEGAHRTFQTLVLLPLMSGLMRAKTAMKC